MSDPVDYQSNQGVETEAIQNASSVLQISACLVTNMNHDGCEKFSAAFILRKNDLVFSSRESRLLYGLTLPGQLARYI